MCGANTTLRSLGCFYNFMLFCTCLVFLSAKDNFLRDPFIFLIIFKYFIYLFDCTGSSFLLAGTLVAVCEVLAVACEI